MVVLTQDQGQRHGDLDMQQKIESAVEKMVEELKKEDEDDMMPSQAVSESGGSPLPRLAAAVLRLVRYFISHHMLKYVRGVDLYG